MDVLEGELMFWIKIWEDMVSLQREYCQALVYQNLDVSTALKREGTDGLLETYDAKRRSIQRKEVPVKDMLVRVRT